MWFLVALAPALVPTPLHPLLFIVELILLHGRSLYVYRGVIHVLV